MSRASWMCRKGVWLALASVFTLAGLFASSTPAAQEISQTREFSILVDNKERGQLKMVIKTEDNGTESMTSDASVRVNYLVYNYQYTSQNTEVWRDSRLQELQATANYDGKQTKVQAVNKGTTLSVKVNGQERSARPDVWVTTYYRLPDEKLRNRTLALLDCDTGREMRVELRYVGQSPVTIAGTSVKCAHYRVTGAKQVDLWYDKEERLVRQESVESGHRTILELSKIK